MKIWKELSPWAYDYFSPFNYILHQGTACISLIHSDRVFAKFRSVPQVGQFWLLLIWEVKTVVWVAQTVVSPWLVSAVEVCPIAGKRLAINCKAVQRGIGSVRNAFDCKSQKTLLQEISIFFFHTVDQGRWSAVEVRLNHIVRVLSTFPWYHLSRWLLSSWVQDGCHTSGHGICVLGRKMKEGLLFLSWKAFLEAPYSDLHWYLTGQNCVR